MGETGWGCSPLSHAPGLSIAAVVSSVPQEMHLLQLHLPAIVSSSCPAPHPPLPATTARGKSKRSSSTSSQHTAATARHPRPRHRTLPAQSHPAPPIRFWSTGGCALAPPRAQRAFAQQHAAPSAALGPAPTTPPLPTSSSSSTTVAVASPPHHPSPHLTPRVQCRRVCVLCAAVETPFLPRQPVQSAPSTRSSQLNLSLAPATLHHCHRRSLNTPEAETPRPSATPLVIHPRAHCDIRSRQHMVFHSTVSLRSTPSHRR